VKDQDVEIASDCEFLIDESGCLSFKSWFSIPRKNRKSKKDGSATPVLKSQSSEKEKTADKKCKNMKVQAEVHSEQKMKNVRVQRDLKRTPESHPVSSGSEGKVLKSQMRSSTRVGKSKKDALKGSSKHRKKMSYESEAEQLMLSGLDSEASDEEQKIRRVMPREDLPMPSAEHQQEQMLSPKKNLTPCKYQQSASKAYQRSVHKKQTKKKLAKDKVLKSQRKKLKKSGKRNGNKNPEPQRWKSSDTESGEEGLERELLESNEMFTSPPHQELQTSALRKLAKSEKAEKVLRTLESVTDVNNKTPLKAVELLQHLVDSMKNSEKKRSSATSSGKMLKKIDHRAHKRACSAVTGDPEPQNTTDSDSSSAQEVARKKRKQSAVKRSKKRKSNRHQRLQHSTAAEKAMGPESGLVLEHPEKYTLPSKHCEENYESSDNSEDLHCQIKNLLSDEIGRQKIVLPSNTPNVRRTKRIRLKPLDYWRGERLTYTLKPSGRLLISGIAGAEGEPHMKNKLNSHHKQKRAKTKKLLCNECSFALRFSPVTAPDSLTENPFVMECVSDLMQKTKHNFLFCKGNVADLRIFWFSIQAFYVIHGQIIITLHKTSYYLTSGDYFYVPAGNGYNVRNLLNEESVLHFTQLKNDRKLNWSWKLFRG
uniref:Mif2/CENP-C cupin domain-containing protein n=1 Tax=Pavo cristatus TaxID=9049 RepID=A0A8C9GB44_PAVCR